MRNYRKLFLFPCVMILVILMLSGFAMGEVESEVQGLLDQRTGVLQKVYYGEITDEAAERQLAEIETFPLLSEDIGSLRNRQPGEMDKVLSMDILKISPGIALCSMRTYVIVVCWKMQGMEEDYKQTVEYSVTLKKVGNKLKLSVFSPVTPKR